MYRDDEPKITVKKLKEVDSYTPVQHSGQHKAKPHPQPLVTEGGAKFDRNSYQREYMRKWRAKKRVPSHGDKTGP